LVFLLPAFGAVEFNRDVRPILSDKCFHCHGPDGKNKGVPMRLDIEADAKAERGGRRAVVEGDPQKSELIKRVSSSSTALRMPPVHTGLTLSASEIETLGNWIAEGAKWQKHWSFIPPVRRPAQGNAIDYFVRERLKREGLGPSTEANRETLIRRVSLDLTGVPPTPAEVDAFLNDRSAHAYEKVVDRLLKSPRYGERMAIRWLEAARYADTNGYQYDGEREMWRWRDWVIEAFNRNQPYNEFVVEQIAGDMLPGATLDQKIATGFNRNHRGNTEDGIVPEEYAVEYVVDRVETTSTVFLGLTLGCARCHNHKYDPITQREFYQVYAYFNNIPELGRAMKYGNSPPLVPAPTREQQSRLNDLDKQIARLEAFFRDQEAAIDKAQRAWERTLVSTEQGYWAPRLTLDHAFTLDDESGAKAEGTITHVPGRIGRAASFDGKSYLNSGGEIGGYDIQDRFTLSAWVYSEKTPHGAVISKMADNPRGRGYGVYLNKGRVHVHLTSNYADDAIRADSEETLTTSKWNHLLVTYTGSRMAEGVTVFIDGKRAKLKVSQDTLYRPFRNAGRAFLEPFRIGGGGGAENRFAGLIDDVRVYGRVLGESEIAALAVGRSVNELAANASRQPAEKQQLRWYFLENAATPQVREAWNQLTQYREQREKLERNFSTVMVMEENPVRRDTHVLTRGVYNQPGEKVEPGVPEVLPELPAGAPNNRLGFARWVADATNPLSARVAVNRLWQMYFGNGLVKTSEDFGLQGEWPSHPELLDWLATEFVRLGWDTKALARLIVTSATYRQTSKAPPELMQRDPENRLLARGPRFRLPAEMVRDQALFVSGLVKERLGGPSVRPYQPEGLWKELAMQDVDYVQGKGDDLHRRSLYTFWKRTVNPPLMANFDSPARESCVVREVRTNTPLQALNLMNDVTFVEAARFLGQRMMKEGGKTVPERLRYGFRLVTARMPRAEEERVLAANLAYHLDYFASKPERMKEYLSQGESRVEGTLDQRQIAAYASVASLLLNLDEAVTKE
jgi:hypothetical protein